jgi:hypothetical protein
MASSGMLRTVALLTRGTRRNIPEDAILQFFIMHVVLQACSALQRLPR